MGVSTNAYLVFGVRLPDDSVEEFEERDDDAEHEAEKQRNPLGWMTWEGAYLDGIELVRHCSDDYPEYIAAPKGAKYLAWRGHPVAVTSIEVKPEWLPTLRAFCEKHSIPWGEPQWWLASYWS